MTSCFELSNGVLMPKIGLGTFKTKGYELIRSCLNCAFVESHYSLVDTARVYKNEGDIGKALFDDLKVERSKIFITSKLSPKDQVNFVT